MISDTAMLVSELLGEQKRFQGLRIRMEGEADYEFGSERHVRMARAVNASAAKIQELHKRLVGIAT